MATSNQISKCSYAQNGGAYYLGTGVALSDTSSSYTNIGAVNGGVIFCVSCSLTLTDISISNFYAKNGGVIYLQD